MANLQNLGINEPGSPEPEPTTTSDRLASPPASDASVASRGTGSVTGAATATARTFYDQAKETAGKAYEAATEKAAEKLDEQKSTLSEGLSTVATSVRQVSSNLGSSETESGLAEAAAKYTGTAARKIDDVANYFETKGVRDMARDLENFARRNPAVFFGAAFGLGILLARFLKSTPTGSYDAAPVRRDASGRFETRNPSQRNVDSIPDSLANPR